MPHSSDVGAYTFTLPRKAQRVLSALQHRDAPLFVVCAALIVLGIWLRAHALADPPSLTFDEHHFVNNARAYLEHTPDLNDHPPLGKLFIALGMLAWGDQSVGWRFFPLCFGLANIGLAALGAFVLFGSQRAALLAAALVAGDGFFIAYSRTALLDGMLTFFIGASALVTWRATRGWHLTAAATLGGLAMAIKLNGVVTIAPLILAIVLRRPRFPLWAWATPCLTVATYFLVFALGLAIGHQSFTPAAVWSASQSRVTQHLHLTAMTNPATSYWYTWFLPTRPITMRYLPQTDPWITTMTSLGNLALWWSMSVAMLGFTFRCLWWGPKLLLERLASGPTAEPGFFNQHLRAVVALVVAWAAPIVPWIVSSRDSYIYHYLPAYFAGAIMMAGLIDYLARDRPRAGLCALLVYAEVTVFYAPVWTQLPLTRLGSDARLFFAHWR